MRQGERRIQVHGDLPLPLDTAARSVHTLKEHPAIHSTGSIGFKIAIQHNLYFEISNLA